MTRMHYLIVSLLWLCCFSTYAFDEETRVAFYYGVNPPLEELHAYHVVVVTPQNGLLPKEYNNRYSQLFAYVNVGEVNPNVDYFKKTQTSWRKGSNPLWGSYVMDMANPAWRDYLLEHVITPLWQNDYRGFFLDSLDSYRFLNLSPEQARQQRAGLITLIKKIKAKYPDAQIIVNRGFEIFNSIHHEVSAVAAESLFAGWNATTKRYQAVAENDRRWLLNQLNKIRDTYHLPVIVIDYLAPNERDKARKIAKQIEALHFIPWVSDARLDTLGVGSVEVVPRKVLLLYDDNPFVAKNRSTAISAFDYGAFPLQFMGFIPVLQPVNETLVQLTPDNRYAGIIAWFSQPLLKHHEILEQWLSKQIEQGIPVLFMQNFGVPKNSPLLKQLDITVKENPSLIKNVSIAYKDKSVGSEVLPHPVSTDFLAITSKGKVLLKLAVDDNEEDAIVITSWGGYVLSPFDSVVLPNEQSRWVINPMSFFQQALRLPLFPVPDVTTVNGKRILTFHIDGDAFISRVPWMDNKYAGEVILEQIIAHYKLPVTVSIIQREFELIQQSQYLSERLKKAARAIFALPYVQIATHTYSHPLDWGSLVENKPDTQFLAYPSKDYLFNYQKEIVGSADFINTQLAPPDKKVVAVFWSGDANVQEKPLEIATENGLKNINGMAKIYINGTKSLTNLGAFGINNGKYFQVFAPIPNEFEYTDSWSQPLYAFQNVIHTFELTDKPVRYKPMSVYYHFYTATDQAALRALKRVYNWAIKQNVIPLQVTDYIDRVNDFNQTVIAKSIQDNGNSWLIVNNKSLNEFRWPIAQGYPDLAKSKNVTGFSVYNNDYYIHLGKQNDTWIRFTKSQPTQPYLVEANAEISQWDILSKDEIRFSLKGYVPLSFTLAGMQHCRLEHDKMPLTANNFNSYHLKDANFGTFEIHCKG